MNPVRFRETRIVLKNIHHPHSERIETYLKAGGYQALEKVLKEMSPQEVIREVERSRLVGRGGAAFPTGLKWKFAREAKGIPKYVVCNADEGEPGTFKDRQILEKDPHLLLEGMAICGYAVGASQGSIYIRGEYFQAYRILKEALKEAEERRFLGKKILGKDFSFSISLYRGAGAYVCGEETALLDSLEGKKGYSRLKPPFPALEGFQNKPTVLNNVETLANIPDIILKGAQWFLKIGHHMTPGTKIYCLSGDIRKAGYYELPTGIRLKRLLLDYGKGVRGELKAILPGGVSSSFLTRNDLSVTLDWPSVAQQGSSLGSGAMIILNDTHCMVDIAKRCAQFFAHESCGKCTPCREGTKRAKEILTNISLGKGGSSDLKLLCELREVMYDTSQCGLGQVALDAIKSAIGKFQDEFEEHIRGKRCPFGICPLNKESS